MSQTSLPRLISASSKRSWKNDDDVSTLSNPNQSSLSWLKPKAELEDIFCFEKQSVKAQAPVRRFFHIIKGVKEGVDMSSVPKYYSDAQEKRLIVCACNLCGKLVKFGEVNPITKAKKTTNSGMCSHLSSAIHDSKGAELLLSELESSQSSPLSKKRNVQKKLGSWAVFGSSKATIGEKQKLQELKTIKFLCSNFLPFSTVESKAFRELIQSHNSDAKTMSSKKVKSRIVEIEALMRDQMIDQLEGESVSVTLDHWTSKANDNYTGVTAHFLINDVWELKSFQVGLFLHHGGTKKH